MKTKILQLNGNDEKKEIDFDLKYLLSLSTSQRLKMIHERSLSILKRVKHGFEKTHKISQRS